MSILAICRDVSIFIAIVALYLFEVKVPFRDTFSEAITLTPVRLFVSLIVSLETSWGLLPFGLGPVLFEPILLTSVSCGSW